MILFLFALLLAVHLGFEFFGDVFLRVIGLEFASQVIVDANVVRLVRGALPRLRTLAGCNFEILKTFLHLQ